MGRSRKLQTYKQKVKEYKKSVSGRNKTIGNKSIKKTLPCCYNCTVVFCDDYCDGNCEDCKVVSCHKFKKENGLLKPRIHYTTDEVRSLCQPGKGYEISYFIYEKLSVPRWLGDEAMKQIRKVLNVLTHENYEYVYI